MNDLSSTCLYPACSSPLIGLESIILRHPFQEMDSPCHLRKQEIIVISSTSYAFIASTETKMPSYWRPSRHWLHLRLSKWQPWVHPVTRRLSPLKPKCHHIDNLLLTGCIWGWKNDNLGWSQGWGGCLHWNQNVIILTTFSSLATSEVVKMTTSGAPGDQKVSPLKPKCHHIDDLLLTGCIWGCQNDNLRCSQWWKGCQYDDLLVSVSVSHAVIFSGWRFIHLI